MDPDRKGTIGLVCIDENGFSVPWYENGEYNIGAFEECIRSVVNKWNRFYDQLFQNEAPSTPANNTISTEVNVNSFLGGYGKFWDLTESTREKSRNRGHQHQYY